jgi:hypothetical protein
MKSLLALSLCLIAGGTDLQTEYSKPRSLRIESELTISTEIVAMTVERDGEPVEMPGTGRGGGEITYTTVLVDELMASKGNKPEKLKRHFEKVGSKATMTMGDQTTDQEVESPFEGAVVVMDGTGDEIKFEFESGSEPDHEEALKNHKLTLPLDGLLPDGEVEQDATWDLEKDAILAALGLNMTRTYFPPPQRDNAGGGEGGGGRGRRMRGMRGAGPGPFVEAEWEGKAKLVSLDEELDGEKVAKIEIKIEAKGTMEDQGPGGGGRRQRMLEPNPTLPERTYSAECEGFLYISIADKRPVKLELEGKNETESNSEMARGESTMKMYMKTEGKFSIKVSIAKEEPKAESKEEKK